MVAGVFGCANSTFDANGACTAGGTSDALAVAYQVGYTTGQADLSPSVPAVVAAGSAFSDCNGLVPPAGTNYVINRYFLTATGQLMCMGNDSNPPTAQILAQNVEQFSVRYGMLDTSTWATTRSVVWQTATQVEAAKAWYAVSQVDLCLVMVAPAGTGPIPGLRNNCDGTTTATTDTRKRTTFRKTVNLRNVAL